MEAAQNPGELQQGQEFPDFDLLDVVDDLGEGGCGTVSKAIVRFTSEGRVHEMEAAVKYAGQQRENLVALKREVVARKRMGPMRGILPVLAMTTANRDPHLVRAIVTPICACSVHDVVARRRQARPDDDHGPVLLPEEYLPLFNAVLAAVGHVHDCGLVHLDIKAPNVLLEDADDFRSVRLADFGLTAQDGDSIGCAGTPLCMAPELEAQNLPVTTTGHRAQIPAGKEQDVYSVSMLLATCVLGRSAEYVNKCRCRSPHEFRKELMACGCTETLAYTVDGGLDLNPAVRPPLARLMEAVHDALRLLAAPQPAPAAVPMPLEDADAMITQANSSAPVDPIIAPLDGSAEVFQRATVPLSPEAAQGESQLDDPAWNYYQHAPAPPVASAPLFDTDIWRTAAVGPVFARLHGSAEDFQRATVPLSPEAAQGESQLDDPAWNYYQRAPAPPVASAPVFDTDIWRSAAVDPVLAPLHGSAEDFQRATELFSTGAAQGEAQLDDPAWHCYQHAPAPPVASAPVFDTDIWRPDAPNREPDCALYNGAHNMTAPETGGPSEVPVTEQICVLGSRDSAVSPWVQADHGHRAPVWADEVREAGSAGVHDAYAFNDKAGSTEAPPPGVVHRQLPHITAPQGRHGDLWAVERVHGTPYAGGCSTATSALLYTPGCGSPWAAGWSAWPSPVLRAPLHAGTHQDVECQTVQRPALELPSEVAFTDVGCNTDLSLPPGALVDLLPRDLDSALLATVQEDGEGERGGDAAQRGGAGMRWGRWAVVAGVAGLVGVVAARALLRKG